MKEPSQPVAFYRAALKCRYLATLAELSGGVATLRQIVNQLVELNVSRSELIRWAAEAGHNERSVRTLVSRLLCGSGIREREPGAGRRIPQEALFLLAFATEKYGDRAARFLRAAARAAAEPTGAAQPEALVQLTVAA
jgi:hypothetical protein